MKEFTSQCPRCGHVEWFYTREGRDRYDGKRESMLPQLPFMKHKHPLPDFVDDMIHSREWAHTLRKMLVEMK